ncbi:MAG: gliding motility-associated C-terminal domain-containing protein [Bacteroidia bacterium]|nr:gliding motility-associated C-terminal domain-containing protein [Bacteroidia bacterium]
MKNKCCNEEPVMEHFDGGYLGIPTVFTPNGDGQNDMFVVFHKGIETFSLKIKNSIGSIIFETTDINESWDGKASEIQLEGRFKLLLEAETVSGISISKEKHICIYASNGESMKCPENVSNCAFPSQWLDADSTFHDNISNGELFDCD